LIVIASAMARSSAGFFRMRGSLLARAVNLDGRTANARRFYGMHRTENIRQQSGIVLALLQLGQTAFHAV
jgi:hypothetical protein